MAQYCDPQKLEANWFNWLRAKSSPGLDPYRSLGLVWTKPMRLPPDPSATEWLHCIAIGSPLWLVSRDGQFYHEDGSPATLPDISILSDFGSEHPMHGLDNPFWVQGCLVPQLQSMGYAMCTPSNISWGLMISDIASICKGIVTKFNQPDEESRCELAQEALTQVMRKLTEGRLVYTPGKASVFNLLTTTIFRIMFSIMNKNTRTRVNTQKLVNDIKSGTIRKAYRSLRVTSPH